MQQPQQQQLVLVQEIDTYVQEFKTRNSYNLNEAREIGYAKQIIEDPRKSFTKQMALKAPQSLKNAIMNVADLGITLSPALNLAYLVPMDNMINLFVSYRGMARLAELDGGIVAVQASLVYEKDTFETRGVFEKPLHSFSPFQDRGEVIGVYCVALLPDGTYMPEIMSRKECLAIRDRSKIWMKSKSGPWLTDEGEMLKKTVIKRAAKLWPTKGERLAKAIAHADLTEGLDSIEDAVIVEDVKSNNEEFLKDEKSKKDLIEHIRNKFTILTHNKELKEKQEFFFEHTGVPSSNYLKQFLLEKLIKLDEKLNKMIKENEKDEDIY